MARSSLSGIDRNLPTPSGHDTAALGPSDSSDSGSDIAGVEDLDDGDPGLPVDVMTAADKDHPAASSEALGPGGDTDAAGTGERRSAVGDAGELDAPDISPDRVVSLQEMSAPLDDIEPPVMEEELPEGLRAEDLAMAAEVEGDAEAAAEEDVEEPQQATPKTDAPRAAQRKPSSRASPRKRSRAKGGQAKVR
jgi:hypothetical protein